MERLGRLSEDCKEDFSDGRNLDASLRAKFCTDSIEWQRVGEEGAQMAEQYSRWGRTSETYSLIMVEAEE